MKQMTTGEEWAMFRERMLEISAEVGQGTGESGHVTIQRAIDLSRWVYAGGWMQAPDGMFFSTNVMEAWQVPMPSGDGAK